MPLIVFFPFLTLSFSIAHCLAVATRGLGVVRRVDPAAYEQAIRKWALPPCLHIPIVAKDEDAIRNYVGDIKQIISPQKALLIEVDPPPPADLRLPIFKHPNAASLFEPTQLWVSPRYTRYRSAWKRAFGSEQIEGKVLHHIYNRRMAVLRGFQFVRLAPISRSTNSSSAFTEQWGVELFTADYVRKLETKGFRMQYADLGDLMTMLDIPLGGGVLDVFRIGQNLVETPGKRPPQR